MTKDTPYEKWTRASFKVAYEEAEAMSKKMRTERDDERGRRQQAEARIKETEQQFSDLKQRLLAAEQANQFMRGYLARVQEDDSVREELVTVGDPDGEQRMVPKRKSATFERPDDFTRPNDRDQFGMGYVDQMRERDHKPKHWITY